MMVIGSQQRVSIEAHFLCSIRQAPEALAWMAGLEAAKCFLSPSIHQSPEASTRMAGHEAG